MRYVQLLELETLTLLYGDMIAKLCFITQLRALSYVCLATVAIA
jgi:hypothetical protein